MTDRRVFTPFANQRSLHKVYSVERLEGDTWVPAGEFAATPDAIHLTESALGHARYSAETHALLVYGGSGTAGRLDFTQDGSAFIGTLTDEHGASVALRGVVRSVVYHTKRRLKSQPSAPLTAWDDFSIKTEWVDENAIPVLKITYTLGTTDVSDRTTVTHVDREKGETVIEMVPSLSPFGDQDAFEITLFSGNQTFAGTYTAADESVYDWTGAVAPQQSQMLSSKFKVAAASGAPVTMNAARAATQTLSPQDLDNISSLQVVTDGDGQKITIDWAQRQCGDYFNKCLINGLDQTWIDQIYGHSYLVPPNVQTIFESKKSFFQSNSTLGTGQMIYDQFATIDRYKEIVKRVKPQAMKDVWDSFGKDSKIGVDYQEISNALYIQGYRDGVAQMQPYLADKTQDWGKIYFDWLSSDSTIAIWQAQIASHQFDNVKTRMYEWYVKLQILSPDKDYAQQFTSIAYSALLGVAYSKATWSDDLKPFLTALIGQAIAGKVDPAIQTEAQQNMSKDMQAALLLLVGTEDKVVQIADAISAAMTIYMNKKPKTLLGPATQSDEFIEEVDRALVADPNAYKAWGELKAAGKAKGLMGTVFYGASAGFLIYTIVNSKDKPLTARTVVEDINLGILSLAMLAKGVQKMMSLGVGRFLERFSQAGEGGAFRFFAGELATWFKAGGKVIPEGLIGKAFIAVFGENVSVFLARRIGPAMAVVGVVLSALFLADAIKSGKVKDIVFEAINTFFALASLVLIGFELMSFAWAGPVGLAVAVVGLIVVLVQFIWNLIDPPPPPPDPIADFVNGPMVDKGFATR